MAETGETCNFGTLSGSEVIYLDRVESKWPLGLRFAAGSRVPAHCTAIGKLIDQIARHLLRLGAQLEVLDPPELRAHLTEVASGLASLYGDPP